MATIPKITVDVTGNQMDIMGQLLAALVLRNYDDLGIEKQRVSRVSITMDEIAQVAGYVIYAEDGEIRIEVTRKDKKCQ